MPTAPFGSGGTTSPGLSAFFKPSKVRIGRSDGSAPMKEWTAASGALTGRTNGPSSGRTSRILFAKGEIRVIGSERTGFDTSNATAVVNRAAGPTCDLGPSGRADAESVVIANDDKTA